MSTSRRCAAATRTLDVGRADLGAGGETLAADHLAVDGLEVVARNWRLAAGEVRGELDLVALDHREGRVVVCEVKTRRSSRFGSPLDAVTPRKQAAVRRLSLALLREAELPYARVRFDVIGLRVTRGAPTRLEHLWGAF